MKIELTFPLPPNVANQRGHWSRRYRVQKKWRQEAAIAVVTQGVRFPNRPWPQAWVACRFFVWNIMDEDNLAARQKVVLDYLKATPWELGFFKDDSPKYLELATPRQQIDRKNPRVEVTIVRLDGERGPDG